MKKKILSGLVVAIVITLFMQAFVPINSFAAGTYKGSGTKADPYLVETASQLDGIRANLSASYKLANTIDLSSFANFKPIGRLDKRFTGSLVCDSGTDGFPLYAIKNLKITVNATPYLDVNISKWEAALFGATSGSTFTNIYLLNVKVVNKVVGSNTGAVVYNDYKPGMDEMNCAALVGDAESTTIKGCASTGSVSGNANNTGGLVGNMNKGSISNSYSSVTVTSTGLWQIGGLIGSCNAKVTNCFATGDVTGGNQNCVVAGLIGSIPVDLAYPISNCYSTGKVLTPKALSFIGHGGDDPNLDLTSITSNCYTISSIKDCVSFPADKTAKNNNCILSTVKGKQNGYAAVSKASLLKAFSSLSDWNTVGVEYPQLKAVKMLTNESRYVPGAVITESGNNTQAATTANTSITKPGETTVAPATVNISALANRMNALPAEGKFTAANVDEIYAIKKAYDALSDSEKENIPSDALGKMMVGYREIMPFVLISIVADLEKLPAVDKLTIKNKEKVLELNDKYEFLNDTSKSAMSTKLVARLKASVEKVKTFKEAVATAASSNDHMSSSELLLVIVLSTLIVAVIGFNVYLSLVVYKKRRNIAG